MEDLLERSGGAASSSGEAGGGDVARLLDDPPRDGENEVMCVLAFVYGQARAVLIPSRLVLPHTVARTSLAQCIAMALYREIHDPSFGQCNEVVHTRVDPAATGLGYEAVVVAHVLQLAARSGSTALLGAIPAPALNEITKAIEPLGIALPPLGDLGDFSPLVPSAGQMSGILIDHDVAAMVKHSGIVAVQEIVEIEPRLCTEIVTTRALHVAGGAFDVPRARARPGARETGAAHRHAATHPPAERAAVERR